MNLTINTVSGGGTERFWENVHEWLNLKRNMVLYTILNQRKLQTSLEWSWGIVHTIPEKFEDAALFLRLGLPSTLIRHEKGPFRKHSSNRRNLKTAFRFCADGKHFETRAFRKRWSHDNHVISPTEISLKHKYKLTGDCCVFTFLRRGVDGKHLMRFQRETSIVKFPRRSVNAA